MTRLLVLGSAIALATSLAAPASAQVAGLYAGTSADGSGVQFTVSTDPSNGALAITSASVGFAAPCNDHVTTLYTGWGYGLNADIVNRHVKDLSAGSYFTISFNLAFSADGQSATGKIFSVSPTLSPVGPKPTRALICRSPTQAMSVTLQPPTARVAPVSHGATAYDRIGRPIGQIQR
jgi:hypothetical protein